MPKKSQFLGVCGTLRKDPKGEALWHKAMNSAIDIPKEAFDLLVSETKFTAQWGSTRAEADMQDPTARTFLCLWDKNPVVAYQNAGWEYFWHLPK